MKPWRVPYPKFGAGPGLERIRAIAAHLGVDLAAFGRSGAVIVGSNGKGSTAAMCAALLRQTGAPIGLFTSPHLVDLNERFRAGDEDISDEELEYHWRRVDAAVRTLGVAGELGGFEFLFLIAADWFAARGCVHTVWEAGLGGRLDPVKLIEARNVALTSLDLEHTHLLGDTLEQIALEKIEVAAPGARLAVASPIAEGDSELGAGIEAWCAARNVTLRWTAPLGAAPLLGAHQLSNAALALELACGTAPLTNAQVEAGFASTRWPGRLEVLSETPLVVIDVGHTPAAIAAARRGFDAMRGDRRAMLMCGFSHDKDVSAMMHELAPGFGTIICAAALHKGAPPAEVAAVARSVNDGAEIVLADNVDEARRVALARAGAGAIYVAGGLFLAAEFKAVHLGRDPASLVFF